MTSAFAHAIRVSSLPLTEIIQGNYIGDYNPPLYFALLHLQRRLSGDSVMAMRLPSLVFAMLSLPLFYFLAHSIFKAFIPSLAALLLAAFHPMLIYYSVEIRSYSLLFLFSTLSFLSCERILDGSPRRGAWAMLLALGACGCVYTHYFGIIVLLSMIVFIAAWSLFFKRWTGRETISLLSVGIAALLYLPGFFLFRSQALAIPSSPELIPLAQSLQVFTFSINPRHLT